MFTQHLSNRVITSKYLVFGSCCENAFDIDHHSVFAIRNSSGIRATTTRIHRVSTPLVKGSCIQTHAPHARKPRTKREEGLQPFRRDEVREFLYSRTGSMELFSSASCHGDATRLIDALTKGFSLPSTRVVREATRRRKTMLRCNHLKINFDSPSSLSLL